MPEKLKLQRLLEQRDTNSIGPLSGVQRVVLLESGAVLTLTGSLNDLKLPLFVNGIEVKTNADREASGALGPWSVQLRAATAGSGKLAPGLNTLRMTGPRGNVLDTAYIERTADARGYAAAVQEQRIVDLFLASKTMDPSNPSRITIDDLYLDDQTGYLRRKTASDPLHARVNLQGKPLSLKLLTSPTPETYPKVAEMIKAQWRAVGVEVKLVVPKTKKEFEQQLISRDYDVILFGQSLLDNLDAYPYWHSSQIQEREDPKKFKLDAFNLSQYTSFEADTLLTRIRETGNEKSRQSALADLNERIKQDVPAIFLYSPLYVFAYDDSVRGITLGKLAVHSDRFGNMYDWHLSTGREFAAGKGWMSFVPWLFRIGSQ